MKYIDLNEVPPGTWHAIASEDLEDFSKSYLHAYARFLMHTISDKKLKAELINFDSMEGATEDKQAAKTVKEWILCKPIEKTGDKGVAEGIDQSISFMHAASAAQKPIRTMMFSFFQQVPQPHSFIVINPQ